MVTAGIIGFGYMGNFHLNKSREVEGIEVIAAYDINPEKLGYAKEDNLLIYDDLNDFLNNEKINLVIICTPNDSHATLAIAALNAGKNVLCEKPVTMNTDELLEVIECAKRNNKLFTTHQNRRWDVDYRVAKETVDKGLIGGVTTIVSQVHGQRGVCFGWRADAEKGGGMLLDWGIHLVDQLLMMFEGSKVISVYARLRSILTPVVDDYFELELEFDNEVVAHICVGTFALQEQPRWFVFGDKGTLKLDDFSGTKGGVAKIQDVVRGFKRVKTSEVVGPSRTMAHLEKENLEEIELPKVEKAPLDFYFNLVNALEGKEAINVTHEQMVRDMRIVDAAFESSKSGMKLKVEI